MSDAVPHLIDACLLRACREGRGARIAIRSGGLRLSYEELARTVAAGARWMRGEVPEGTPLRVASRNQLHVALATLAALAAERTIWLADPNARDPGPDDGSIRMGDEDLGVCERWIQTPGSPADLPSGTVSRRAPAFGVFTSGSTGEPKPVLHGHAAPLATFEAFGSRVVGLGPQDVTIATAGLPFVYALGNALFFPLLAGGSTILPADLLLPSALAELAQHEATVLVTGPWSLDALLRLTGKGSRGQRLEGLRRVLCAGEPLPESLHRAWATRFGHPPLDNLGCTELFNSFLSNLPGDERAGTLGRALEGFEVEIDARPPVPGAQGALRVRGKSLALSMAGHRVDDGAWHETGDQVAIDEGGRFVFLGRLDHRFKVQGRFVHPAAVERHLLGVPGVRECLVSAEIDDRGRTRVAVDVVPTDPADESLAPRLRRHARVVLAPFERPSSVRFVDALPRTARGKLQRPVTVTSPSGRPDHES